MSWQDIGFNDNLSIATTGDQLDPQAFFNLTDEISGSKMTGVVTSKDARLKLDLDNNTLSFTKGVQQILLGNLPDGSFGFQFIDQNNKKIISLNEIEKFLAFDSSLILKRADDDSLILDQNGINSANNFILASHYNSSSIGGVGTTSASYLDAILDTATADPGYPISITLIKPTPVLILLWGRFDMDSSATNVGKPKAAICIDGITQAPTIGWEIGANVSMPNIRLSLSTHILTTLSTGKHTIQFKMLTTNSRSFNVYDFGITVLSLGK